MWDRREDTVTLCSEDKIGSLWEQTCTLLYSTDRSLGCIISNISIVPKLSLIMSLTLQDLWLFLRGLEAMSHLSITGTSSPNVK